MNRTRKLQKHKAALAALFLASSLLIPKSAQADSWEYNGENLPTSPQLKFTTLAGNSYEGNTLTINNVNLASGNIRFFSMSSSGGKVGTVKDNVFTIHDGTFNYSYISNNDLRPNNYNSATGSGGNNLIINGGTFHNSYNTGGTGLESYLGDIVINGGTFDGKFNIKTTGKVEIHDGANISDLDNIDANEVTIDGGTITGSGTNPIKIQFTEFGWGTSGLDKYEVNITGGTINNGLLFIPMSSSGTYPTTGRTLNIKDVTIPYIKFQMANGGYFNTVNIENATTKFLRSGYLFRIDEINLKNADLTDSEIIQATNNVTLTDGAKGEGELKFGNTLTMTESTHEGDVTFTENEDYDVPTISLSDSSITGDVLLYNYSTAAAAPTITLESASSITGNITDRSDGLKITAKEGSSITGNISIESLEAESVNLDDSTVTGNIETRGGVTLTDGSHITGTLETYKEVGSNLDTAAVTINNSAVDGAATLANRGEYATAEGFALNTSGATFGATVDGIISAEANTNTLNVTAATVAGVFKGITAATGAANNTFTFTGASTFTGAFKGITTGAAATNTLSMTGGTYSNTFDGVAATGAATGNTVSATNGTYQGNYKGISAGTTAENNNINVTGSAFQGTFDGIAATGAATGNTLTFTGASTFTGAAKGITAASATENTLNFTAGTYSNTFDGITVSGASSENTLTANNGTYNGNYKGISAASSDGDEITLTGGTYGGTFDGITATGAVTGGKVTVTGSTFTGVFKGITGETVDNGTITATNATFGGDIIGFTDDEYVQNSTMTLDGTTTINGNIYLTDAATSTNNTLNLYTMNGLTGATLISANKNATGTNTGNTLNIKNVLGATAGNIEKFKTINIYVPATATNGSTVLTLANGNVTNLSGTNIRAGIAGDTEFGAGDEITLLKNAAGLTTDAATTYGTLTSGVSLIYDGLTVKKKDDNNIILTIPAAPAPDPDPDPPAPDPDPDPPAPDPDPDPPAPPAPDPAPPAPDPAPPAPAPTPRVNPEIKSLLAGQIAAAEIVNELIDAGDAIRNAEIGDGIFGVISAANVRNADTRGKNAHFIAGYKTVTEEEIAAAYVAYGRGNYDSDLAGINADGSTDYIGVGGYYRKALPDDLYFAGGINAGQVRRDYTGSGFSTVIDSTSHDKEKSAFVGGFLRLGKEWPVMDEIAEEMYSEEKGKFGIYMQYSLVHVGGYDAKLSSGEAFSWDALDRHGLTVGGTYEKRLGKKGKIYGDLSVTQTFGGTAQAHFRRGSVEEDTKGTIAALSVGWKQEIAARQTVDLSLRGIAGSRTGGAVNVSYNYTF